MNIAGLRGVPDDLIRRKGTPSGDATRARKLLRWLDQRTIRATLRDIEDERQRRWPDHSTTNRRPTS